MTGERQVAAVLADLAAVDVVESGAPPDVGEHRTGARTGERGSVGMRRGRGRHFLSVGEQRERRPVAALLHPACLVIREWENLPSQAAVVLVPPSELSRRVVFADLVAL